MDNSNKHKVIVWLNDKAHKTLHIAKDTTSVEVVRILGELLQVPSTIQPYFALHVVIDGEDQGPLKDSTCVVVALEGNKTKFSPYWGESNNNGFIYQVNEESLQEHFDDRQRAKASEGSRNLRSSIEAIRSLITTDRKGIGHQRSKSSPAVTPETHHHRNTIGSMDAAKLASLSQNVDALRLANHKTSSAIDEIGKHTQEKRSSTPTPVREPLGTPAVSQEEKDEIWGEAKGLGASTAPHLEPRIGNSPSPSPPRASLRTRSQTIAYAAPPLLNIKPPPANTPSPLSSPKIMHPSPRAMQLSWDESLPKGGSLGRSQGKSLGKKALLPTALFDLEKSTEGDIPVVSNGGATSSKGRSASPPPPRQRYTPPPTILSPMVASVLGASSSPFVSPATRQRSQTVGAKPPQKWVKVRASSRPGQAAESTTSDDDLSEVLRLTMNRLKTET